MLDRSAERVIGAENDLRNRHHLAQSRHGSRVRRLGGVVIRPRRLGEKPFGKLRRVAGCWTKPRACYLCSLRAHRFVPPFILFCLFAGALYGQALFVKPVKVLGDPNFIGTAANPLAYDSSGPNWVEGRELNQPIGIALDNSVSPPIVYIADTGNNRVLAYHYATQLTAGAPADLILGQPDRFTNLPQGPNGASLTTGFRTPSGLAVDSAGNLYVADSGDNRILRYPKPFAQPAGYQFPDLIIGQTSFATSAGNSGGVKATTLELTGGPFFPHTGLAFDSAGNLWVTDTGNNLVLRFPVAVLVPNQNDPAADTVIGQVDLVSSVGATTRTTKSGLSFPTSVAFDSAGNMLVADALARVVVYPPGSTTNATASRILGVAVPTSTQPTPPAVSAINVASVSSAIAAGNSIVVVDTGNHRVLVYPAVSTWPPESTQFSPSAGSVIGQSTFSASMANQGGPTSATTLSSPVDVVSSASELFVTDSGNNRVMVYPSGISGPSATASRVIGQLDFPYAAPNLVIGEEFYTAGSSGSPSGSAILDLSATPPHLYVADTLNNRVLGFNDFTHLLNGKTADLVIGQPDLFHTTVNYPSNVATTLNAQGLNSPSSLAVDSAGNLYVADTLNGRILRFPAPFASGTTNLETADLVIGQADFVSSVPDPTALTMGAPTSLAFTMDGANASMANSGYLVAADAIQNRVLFFAKPFSNGMSAAKVLGQPDFTSSSASAATTGLAAPRGVAVDPLDRILVADTGNSRVEIFSAAQTLSNDPAPSFILTNGLNGPFSIGMTQSGEFWVADPSQNQLLHFASIDNLPIDNYTSDTALSAVGPRSAFVDPYNNLLVADGINRILYFAPALGVVNAANYISGRALAPGAFAAIFPAVSTNKLAGGTGTATSLPLPTVLADTQVIVNNNASPLLYVSPGQINLPLSMSLPAGGTVDLQVVAQSTGQVYGGAEVALNSASPGLFTIGGTGTGQVAAQNQDGSTNSATNAEVRGSVMTLYGTGQGFVANAPPDGQAATGPVSTAVTPQILLGGVYVPSANIQYSGLAPTLVGVWQINFQVPTTAQAGNSVPIIVLMNSIPSDNPSVPGQIATTIALK
jgi:uncharacterized protein (TIGR03437 family)